MNISTITATIFLTDKCNLACKYCYEKDKEFKTIKKEYIDKFIALLFTEEQYCRKDEIVLDFIGGEPLLEPELIQYAIDKFTDTGKRREHKWILEDRYMFNLSTNGTLFSESKVKTLLDNNHRLFCGVSLDGNQEAHDLNRVDYYGNGSYEKIMENFDWWKSKYRQPMVKGTFNPETLPMLSGMLINQIKLGMTSPWCNPIFEHLWTAEEGAIYEKELLKVTDYIFNNDLYIKIAPLGKKEAICNSHEADNHSRWCGTGKYMVSLGMDGKLYPCHRFSTGDSHYAIGDVFNGLDRDKLEVFIKDSNVVTQNDENDIIYPTCYASYYDQKHAEFANKNNTKVMYDVEFKIRRIYLARLEERCRRDLSLHRLK